MTITGSGNNFDLVVLTVTATADTQIGFHFQTNFNEIIIRERTTNGLQLRRANGNGDYFTIPSGSALDLNLMSKSDGIYELYLRAATGTSVVEIIGLY